MEIPYQQDQQFNELNYHKIQQQIKIASFGRLKGIKQNKIFQLPDQFCQRKRKNPLGLKQLVLKAKVNILIKNFIRKMKRGKVYNQLPDHINNKQGQESINYLGKFIKYLQNTQGIDLSPIMLCVWSFINIIQISVMVIIFSIMIAFPETQNLDYFVAARIFSVTLYGIDMALNFITQRHQIGGHKRNLKDIAYFYFTNQFTPDFFSIFIFPLSYAFSASQITPFIMLIALFKLKNNLKRFQSYQFIYVKTTSREQYYSLIKVFLLNFSIGHILSILLNLMATLSPDNESWLGKLGLNNAQWYIKYVWGYYWGTNIMLTVGFGDLSAANTTQATILIFIQTMSCITLAYNISCVGAIIGEMKAENQQRRKKLKYFHRMCEENKISEELEQKINNFIQQSYLIKEQFQLEQYQDVINSLPKSMQSEYRKQANKGLFQVGFFNSLNNKTILNLAQFVIRKVAHPQQIIQKKGQVQHFCILQKGCLGFTYKNGPKSQLNGMIIQNFQVDKGQVPKILSLDFVKRRILKFDVKSIFYSVYYYLTYEQFMKILQTCEMDYQFFLYMKDRDDNILGSNQIYKCKICFDDYHSLFDCPKYHYIPIKQIIISNYIKKQEVQRNQRNKMQQLERQYEVYKALIDIQKIQIGQSRYLKQNYDQSQINQIANIKKYYYKRLQQTHNQPHYNTKRLFQMLSGQANPLQMQINKIQDILTKANGNISVQFWYIQSDAASNFSYYFKQFNPNRLIQFKLFQQKKKGKQCMFGVHMYRRRNSFSGKNKQINILGLGLQNINNNNNGINRNQTLVTFTNRKRTNDRTYYSQEQDKVIKIIDF